MKMYLVPCIPAAQQQKHLIYKNKCQKKFNYFSSL